MAQYETENPKMDPIGQLEEVEKYIAEQRSRIQDLQKHITELEGKIDEQHGFTFKETKEVSR